MDYRAKILRKIFYWQLFLQKYPSTIIAKIKFKLGDRDDHSDRYKSSPKPITIGEYVWLGMNVTVLKGLTIGEHSIIGANSVVTKDIPAYCIAAGNPCRVIRTIK